MGGRVEVVVVVDGGTEVEVVVVGVVGRVADDVAVTSIVVNPVSQWYYSWSR